MLDLALIFILIFIALYLIFCLLLVLFQNKIIYQPSRTLLQTPKHIGLDYDNLKLKTADNESIHAWFIPANNAQNKTTLLFFHGNDGNVSTRLETLALFNTLGLNTLIFDYRGYGESQGIANEKNTYEDGKTALNYLLTKRQLNYQDIILFGRSLGGGIATELACHYPVKALVLESTYTSIPAAAQDVYRWFPIRLLVKTKYDNLSKIKQVKSPILIIHSIDDDYIPYKHGVQLFETAVARKTFLQISGNHGDGFLSSGQTYTDGLKSFLQTLESDRSMQAQS